MLLESPPPTTGNIIQSKFSATKIISWRQICLCFCITQGVSHFYSSFPAGSSNFGIMIVVEKKLFSMPCNVDRYFISRERSFPYMPHTCNQGKANSCIVLLKSSLQGCCVCLVEISSIRRAVSNILSEFLHNSTMMKQELEDRMDLLSETLVVSFRSPEAVLAASNWTVESDK